MSLPQNAASTLAVAGRILYPDSLVSNELEDFEDGGIGVQDSSAGLMGYRWRCWLEGVNIRLQRDGLAATTLFSASGVTALSFAFDQAMRPNVAYQLADGVVHLRWYDSTVPGYVTSTFGVVKNPRMCLDDKRIEQVQRSDVILAYLRNGSLLYRQQRDRYAIERTLSTGVAPTSRLKNIGMGDNLRLHFELV